MEVYHCFLSNAFFQIEVKDSIKWLITVSPYKRICVYRVSHSSGVGGPLSYDFFQPPPPTKTNAPHGVPPPLKNEAPPSEKQPLPLKHETPFHKMIPRKSTINNNLNSS